MADLKITMPEVFEMCNWDYKLLSASKHEYKTICPACNHKTLEVNDFVGQCWNCSEKFNAISFIAKACGIDNKAAYKKLIKEGKIDTSSNSISSNYHGIEENPMADIDKRHKANQIIIDNLFLSKNHKKEFSLKRGVPADLFYSMGYRSYPTDKQLRFKVAKAVKDNMGFISGIPGLYTDKKTGMPTLCWRKRGILVPYRDIHYRIQGFQNRKDESVREKDKDGKLENKYDHVSSGGKKDGTSSSAFVHFACDFYVEWKTKERWPRINDSVFLTEGAMKADIAHYYSGLPFLAIPGVNARTQLEKVLIKLKERGVTKLYDCFDMDYLTNESVQKARNSIKEMCEQHDISYEAILWDEKYKGIDDYLIYLSKIDKLDDFKIKYK